MRVLVDAHMVGENEGGNERYIASLIGALGKSVEVVALVGKPTVKIKGALKTVWVGRSNWTRYLYQIPWVMKRERCELVLTTYFVSPFVWRRNVVMVHDLLPFRKPEYFSRKERGQFWLLKPSIALARAIIVPSEFVKQEIGYFFPQMGEKVRVIPEAAGAEFKQISEEKREKLRRTWQIDRTAVLVLLSKYQKRPWRPIKEALEKVRRKLVVYILNKPSGEDEELRGKHEYRLVKNLTDRELSELYQAVDLVIYGSSYEGFGLPVLEALRSGRALLTTRIPPIVEMLGNDERYFFELEKPETLTKQVEKVWKNRQSVYNVERRYSWSKTARLTEQLFRSLVKR